MDRNEALEQLDLKITDIWDLQRRIDEEADTEDSDQASLQEANQRIAEMLRELIDTARKLLAEVDSDSNEATESVKPREDPEVATLFHDLDEQAEPDGASETPSDIEVGVRERDGGEQDGESFLQQHSRRTIEGL